MSVMEIWSLIVRTLDVLAWPLTIIVLAILFRREVRNRIVHTKRVATPAGDAEFATADELTEKVQEPAQRLVRRGSDHPVEVRADEEREPTESNVHHHRRPSSSSRHRQPNGDAVGGGGDDGGADRRRIEEIIKSSARAGWKICSAGEYATAPDPVIEWLPDGRPRIVGWNDKQGDGLGGSSSPTRGSVESTPSSLVQRLEHEIRQAKIDKYSRLGGNPMWPLAQDHVIEELQRKLEALDPNSPWTR